MLLTTFVITLVFSGTMPNEVLPNMTFQDQTKCWEHARVIEAANKPTMPNLKFVSCNKEGGPVAAYELTIYYQKATTEEKPIPEKAIIGRYPSYDECVARAKQIRDPKSDPNHAIRIHYCRDLRK